MSLKRKRDLIILSLIIKGIILYATIGSAVYFILAVDELSAKTTVIYGIVFGLAVAFIARHISTSDFKRVTWLSREERRDFDNETV